MAVLDSEQALVEDRVRALLEEHDPRTTPPEDFFGAQFDAGLALVSLPVGLGGLEVPLKLQRIVEDAVRAAGGKSAMLRNPLAVGMGFPTLLEHGTQAQLERFLRPAFTCREIWCQLFSEPGSGSDLAALATRARRDGEDWVVNGQKVWTSLGDIAQVGMLVARTDVDQPKHRGLSFFLLDMSSPGVDVRPLRQMTGESEFSEVFLEDVRIPDANLVGEIGNGWRIAQTTLMNERVVLSGAGGGASNVGGSRVERLIDAARVNGAWQDPHVRDELVARYVESRVIRCTNLRARATRRAGQAGFEGSISKLFQGLFNRRLQDTIVTALGVGAVAWDPAAADGERFANGFLRAQGNTIEGGTSNIQRNLLGERVLGLPREPGSPPPDTPWSKLPRNG